MQEKIVQEKVCKHCLANFEITDKDLEFYEKVSPSFAGKKYLIPAPTLCPDCRQQRRLSFRNERNLYKRVCDATGKDIISIYSPDKPFKVYNGDFWWSDNWNALDYGKDFDFSKSFFKQFLDLMREVPHPSLQTDFKTLENSSFVNHAGKLKNCYLTFDIDFSENSFHGGTGTHVNNSMDFFACNHLDSCYQNINSNRNYKVFYSINSNDCKNCYFIENCENCEFCIGCSNLRNKKYYIFNKELSKNDFENFDLKKHSLMNIFENNLKKTIKKYSHIENSENCCGDYITNSKNCNNSYDTMFSENCFYCDKVIYGTNLYDISSWGGKSELLYEGTGIGDSSYKSSFSINSVNIKDSIFSYYCFNSSNLFGCIGLKNKQYCILNKQYTKEEYEILVPKIIEHMKKTGEWGEFFPSSLSPFGYNETIAMEYFPINPPVINDIPLNKGDKSSETRLGGLVEGKFNWSNYEAPFPKVEKIIKAELLPEDISKIPDDILNWAIECEITKKPFRIIKQELDFYRKHNLPIPKRHPDQRHLDRMKLRNPRKLFDRKCDKCGVAIKTTYSPEREEIVYCEECYNKEIY